MNDIEPRDSAKKRIMKRTFILCIASLWSLNANIATTPAAEAPPTPAKPDEAKPDDAKVKFHKTYEP